MCKKLWHWSDSNNPDSVSVFLISCPWDEIKGQLKRRIDEILSNISDDTLQLFVIPHIVKKWCLPRNFDLLYRNASHEDEGISSGYNIWSFELSCLYSWTSYNAFISKKLWLSLSQIDWCIETNYERWLRLEFLEWSTVNIDKLREVFIYFISNFIQSYRLKCLELEVCEVDNGYWWKSIWPIIPDEFDKEEKETLIFSIWQSTKYNSIYFTDLTPIHPDFLHDLLLFLDEVF